MVHNYEIELYIDNEKLPVFDECTMRVYRSKDYICIEFCEYLYHKTTVLVVCEILKTNKSRINKVVLNSANRRGEIYQIETFTGNIIDISEQTYDYDPGHKTSVYLLIFKIDSIDTQIADDVEIKICK